jgi:hypothetical protein
VTRAPRRNPLSPEEFDSDPKVGWTGRFGDWRRFEDGLLAPGHFEVQWADEPRPWIEIRTKWVSVKSPVDGALRLGRAAFRSLNDGAGT